MSMMKLLNISGMLLQFFAFWFAAPELLGVEKLKQWEDKIKTFASKIPTIALGVPGIILLAVFLTSDSNKGGFPYSLPLVLLALFSLRKKLQTHIQERVIGPFFDNLLESDDARHKYLRYGAFLFTIGFFLSLMAAVLG
jgi:hypothetical protein